MRVWDCDPRVLADKHLRAQHAEIHFAIRVIENGWRTRWKDVERFRQHGKGVAWLGFIHDITVLELQHRGKFSTHATPVERSIPKLIEIWDDWTGNWMEYLLELGYPPTRLNQGTPWERDGVTFEWYREHEKTWTKALAKEVGNG